MNPGSQSLDTLILSSDNQCIPIHLSPNRPRVYLHRHIVYKLAGLYESDKEAFGVYDIFNNPLEPFYDRGVEDVQQRFIAEGGDKFAYLSVDALLILLNLDGAISRAGDYNKLLWKNLLSAVVMEAPKLRTHIKMTTFKQKLLKTLVEKYIFYLEHLEEMDFDFEEDNISQIKHVKEEDEDDIGEPSSKRRKENDSSQEDEKISISLSSDEEMNTNSDFIISCETFAKIQGGLKVNFCT